MITSSETPTAILPSGHSAASTAAAQGAALSDSDRRLLLAGHALSTRFESKNLLCAGERTKTHHREFSLSPHFGPSTNYQQKMVGVIQALVAVCTANSGPDAVAVMIGLSPTDLTVFLCQRSGAPWPALRQHLRAVWSILQALRKTTSMSEQPTDITDPVTPRALRNTLSDICHVFAAEKVLHRTRKWLPYLAEFNVDVKKDPDVPPSQKSLVNSLYLVAFTAAAVLKQGFRSPLDERDDWQDFRACMRVLYHETAKKDNESLTTLQTRAEKFGFNFTQSLAKALKLEDAALTLAQFALSPKRGHLTNLALKVTHIPLPESLPDLRVNIDAFADWDPASAPKRTEVRQRLHIERAVEDEMIKITPKIHPECELVARLVENDDLLDGATLIPYICCSKLHCYFCYSWIKAFNLQLPTTRISFDGSHGGVKSGWLPPALADSGMRDRVAHNLRRDIEEALIIDNVEGDFTSSGNDVTLRISATEKDFARVRAVAAAAVAANGPSIIG
ncbi:hypothetical protein C8R46DRAFT_1305967 [Mycena filopes]|nr:hypothetical protein C8R46DRAFT_1305967 [Mycena filopes]